MCALERSRNGVYNLVHFILLRYSLGDFPKFKTCCCHENDPYFTIQKKTKENPNQLKLHYCRFHPRCCQQGETLTTERYPPNESCVTTIPPSPCTFPALRPTSVRPRPIHSRPSRADQASPSHAVRDVTTCAQSLVGAWAVRRRAPENRGIAARPRSRRHRQCSVP
jgi:hypothetical protein